MSACIDRWQGSETEGGSSCNDRPRVRGLWGDEGCNCRPEEFSLLHLVSRMEEKGKHHREHDENSYGFRLSAALFHTQAFLACTCHSPHGQLAGTLGLLWPVKLRYLMASLPEEQPAAFYRPYGEACRHTLLWGTCKLPLELRDSAAFVG
jgi:hypothetical protein